MQRQDVSSSPAILEPLTNTCYLQITAPRFIAILRWFTPDGKLINSHIQILLLVLAMEC